MLDALKLMRIPFSIFLMPVFWFALSNAQSIDIYESVLVFLIVHLLVYPTSNGYNSYFDKDTGSIGGLENPPEVNAFLYPTVLVFDFLALLFSYLINPLFSLLILAYVLVSKAYSYDKIRLKKYPYLSTSVVSIFQGFFMFLSVQCGIGLHFSEILTTPNLLLAVCSSLFLLGSYPITQVYQHTEDSERGDRTISLILGVKGTFIFSSIAFLIGSALLANTFLQHNRVNDLIFFLVFGLPIIIYFTVWFLNVLKNEEKANFKNTMRMNMISSISLSAAFITMILL